MKKVMVKINDKVHGPLEPNSLDIYYLKGRPYYYTDLKDLGAIITEVKEPLVWEGEVHGDFAYLHLNCDYDFRGKRFKATLTEIVEGAE